VKLSQVNLTSLNKKIINAIKIKMAIIKDYTNEINYLV
jgi:hypothetical protein